MNYRKDKDGNDISLLAFGCMRLTKKGGKVDLDKAEKEIMAAYNAGVNYYDTAYVYGGNEEAIGEVFERTGIRDKIYIADKLPHYLIKSREGLEKKFQEQLKRLRTDYIDFYLMHMLTDLGSWEKMKELGIEEWIQEKKANGSIKRIGFSYHGNTEKFCELIDAYDWDFCMIQYNYLDEHSQAGRRGLQYAASKGMPVMIMEPLRGGRLVNQLPPDAVELIKNHPKGYSAAEWGLRWLYNQPEITAVLSGMNSLEMVEENCRIASEAQAGEFGQEEAEFFEKLKTQINKSMKVGCTGCGYCMPCPAGVDIPGAFAFYNMVYSQSKKIAKRQYMQCTIFRHDPTSASLCLKCGKCETHCPQNIKIRDELVNAANELEDPVYKGARKLIKVLKLW